MASAERKPVGGITAVTLALLSGVLQSITLVEERSSYIEEVISDDGILRVHHTLTLVVPRSEVASLLQIAPALAAEGVTGSVTTSAGERLIVGWSNRFILEQPLRLTSFVIGSGARHADGNEATLRFESDDTTALQDD